MIKSTDLITVEIQDNRMTSISLHPPCRICGNDLRNNKIDLPPLPDGTVDKTSVGFQCPKDQNIEIVTTLDIKADLKLIDDMLLKS